MKRARATDHWRRVYTKKYELQVRLVAYDAVTGLGSGSLTFSGGITAICGGNGVGKSTLLDAVAHSLTDASSPRGTRFLAAALRASLVAQGIERLITTRFGPPERTVAPAGEMPVVQRLDPGREAQRLIELVREMKNLDELLEGFSPVQLDAEALDRLGYLVGKRYDSCDVFEIDSFDQLGTFPYFRVKSGGAVYGTESMGHGEFVLHWVMWMLGRIAPKSILLIEEPEAHISPYSQEAMLNLFAWASEEKHIWMILTTHSAGIIRRIPREHTILVYRNRESCAVIQGPTPGQLGDLLGLQTSVRAVALVEDRCAREFATALFKLCAPDVSATLDIRDCGSASAIERLIREFPRSVAGFPPILIGLFDGGMALEPGSPVWLRTHLPGAGGPEALLRGICEDVSSVSAAIGRDEGAVAFALSGIVGLDNHDWLEEFARRVNVNYNDVIRVLVQLWLRENTAQDECLRLVTQLRAVLGLT